MSQIIVITGASRGIGLELCRKFHDNGDRVIAICRQSTDELKELGVKIIENIDVTSTDDCVRLHAAMQNETIDILINNAGVLFSETLEDMNFDTITKQIEVNAIAPLRVTHSLIDRLTEGSKVAMITSRMGSIADNSSGRFYGYRMSKAALNMAGTSLAEDLRYKKIAVALLHPGFVSTRMTSFSGQISPAESAAHLFQRISKLNMSNTGSFWHANGEVLPW